MTEQDYKEKIISINKVNMPLEDWEQDQEWALKTLSKLRLEAKALREDLRAKEAAIDSQENDVDRRDNIIRGLRCR